MEIIFYILPAFGVWFWFDSMSKRERAIALGHELASRFQLQFLDESIACSKIWLKRDGRGQMRLLRTYEFDASANGVDRMQCHLILLGDQLQSWHIPPYLQPLH